MTSPGQISKQPDTSSTEQIRQFLVEAGEVYSRQITAPLIGIWQRELGHIPASKLRAAMSKVFRECKFFPTIADINKAVTALNWEEVLAGIYSGPLSILSGEKAEPNYPGCEECRFTGFVLEPDNEARICKCRKPKRES